MEVSTGIVVHHMPEADLFCHQAELILLELVTETFLASFAMTMP